MPIILEEPVPFPKVGNARAAPAAAATFMNSRRFTSSPDMESPIAFGSNRYLLFQIWHVAHRQDPVPPPALQHWRRQRMRENLISDENHSWTVQRIEALKK